MLTWFGFCKKMVYLCTSEEENARKCRAFSSFWLKNRAKKVVLHYELVIPTLRRKIFLGVCGKFLRNVGARGSLSHSFFRCWNIKRVKVFGWKKLHFYLESSLYRENQLSINNQFTQLFQRNLQLLVQIKKDGGRARGNVNVPCLARQGVSSEVVRITFPLRTNFPWRIS